MRVHWLTALFIVVISGISACNSDYTIKPKGYFKIDFPEHKYQVFNEPGYPYTFEYPVYAKVEKDTTMFDDNDTPYWINIDFPSFQGKIYVSYKTIVDTGFDKLVDDAFKMTYKHTSKATEIQDSLMTTPKGLSGLWFNVRGNTATAKQFFVTDSVKHFLRGALYFDATPNEDSLRIVNEFLQTDMKHLINTLQWKSK